MDNLVTADLILNWLKNAVQEKRPLSPHVWVDACLKLSMFVGDETAKMLELQQSVAKTKFNCIESGGTHAKCKVYVETTDKYKELKNQEAKDYERIKDCNLQTKSHPVSS